MTAQPPGYHWADANPNGSHHYLLPTILTELDRIRALDPAALRVFDLGCGNGSVGQVLASKGWDVTGVDPSAEGISQANRAYPALRLRLGSAYDDLASLYGSYPVVVGESRGGGACVLSQEVRGDSLLFAAARRDSDRLDAIPRLLEESGHGADQQVRRHGVGDR